MPIYDFYCKPCKHKFEELSSYENCSRVTCPTCGNKVERMIAAHGGYTIKGANDGSARPKQAGSFKNVRKN